MYTLKLNTGNQILNLKWFIYISNEYGVPVTEDIKNWFVINFFGYIKNNNFNITDRTKEIFDGLWEKTSIDASERWVETSNVYGWDFYKQLSLDQHKINTEEELRDYIDNFKLDKHKEDNTEIKQVEINNKANIISGEEIDEEGAEPVYLDNTPYLMKKDAYGNYVEVELDLKNKVYKAFGKLYSDGSAMICRGSYIDNLKQSAGTSVRKVRAAYEGRILRNNLQEDIHFKSMSQAGMLVYGADINVWKSFKNKNNEFINLYRFEPKIQEEKLNIAGDKEMYQVYLDNTPELIKQDENGKRYVEIYHMMATKNLLATGRLYDNGRVLVEKGSQIDEVKNSAWANTKQIRQKLSNKIENNIIKVDILLDSLNKAQQLVYGGEAGAWDSWKNNNDKPLRIYTFPLVTTKTPEITNKEIEDWVKGFARELSDKASYFIDEELFKVTYKNNQGELLFELEMQSNVTNTHVVVVNSKEEKLIGKQFKYIEAFIARVLLMTGRYSKLDDELYEAISKEIPKFMYNNISIDGLLKHNNKGV